MALNNFVEVQAFFNDFIENNGIKIATSPHKSFWQQVPGDVGQSYDKFVNGDVPNVSGSIKILVIKNSTDSNIIKILKGVKPFENFRMPYGGPYFSDDQIQELADWIDSGAPQ